MNSHTTTNITVLTPEAMHALGKALARQLQAGDLVLLTGDLGAGKTTLTRGIGAGLNVQGTISSPTFVIARTHKAQNPGQPALVHIDAYRLPDSGELEDLDIDFARSIAVVEWGAGLVDDSSELLEIVFSTQQADTAAQTDWDPETTYVAPRTLQLKSSGTRWQQLDIVALQQAITAAADPESTCHAAAAPATHTAQETNPEVASDA